MMQTEMFLQTNELGLRQSHYNFSADCEQLGLAPKKDMIRFPRNQFARGLIDHLATEKFVEIADTLAVGDTQRVVAFGTENRAPDYGAPDKGLKQNLVACLTFDPEGGIFLDILQIPTVLFEQSLADFVRDVACGPNRGTAFHITPHHVIALIDGEDFGLLHPI